MTLQLDPSQFAKLRERTLDEAEELPDRIGRYRIRGELGHGGMGIVYDAYDPQLERTVAVKVIHNERLRSLDRRFELAERFEKEMRATSELFHPNLVAILDAGVEAGEAGPRAFYVMERVEGESLEQRLRRSGPLDRREGLATALSIARGLAAAHEHGLVHRDLKPANVLLPERGLPKIADFGLCQLRGEVERRGSEAPILGSAHYVAAEQVRSEDVGASADLFSLGAMLVRMFSGREPFLAASTAAHLHRILEDEPDGLERLDPDLRALARDLMAKCASDRPASTQEVVERLEAMEPGAPADEPAPAGGAEEVKRPLPGWRPPSWATGGASRWLMSVLVLLAFSLVCGIALRNELVALDTAAQVQMHHVESQLDRQRALIPELMNVTERYANHETGLLQRVLDARKAYATAGPDDAEAGPKALSRVLVVAEQYPDLKSDRHFLALSSELSGTQNRIAIERMRYNEAAGALNRRLEQLPWTLLSSSLETRPYLTASDAPEPTVQGG